MLGNLIRKLCGKKKQEQKGKKLYCQHCLREGKSKKKAEIKEPSYVLVKGIVISNSRSPAVFVCPEQAFNYDQKILVHDRCYIEMLKEYGSPVYDMDKVYEEYKKKKRGTKFSELK